MTEHTVPLRRVFFALWPDAAALDALEAAAQAGAVNSGGRRMRRDSLHVTLVYIGAVTPAQIASLHRLAAGLHVAPFDVMLDQLGCWPRNGIFWAGSSSVPSGQSRLYAEMSGTLASAGFAVDARPYFPHVTLLRNARCQAVPMLEKPFDCRWRAESFTLVESCTQPSGTQYRVLESWPLQEQGSGNAS